MSHIVSFRIEGLVGREEPLEFKLNRDTNIFFGKNGSGKTSLLKILHAAMSNDTEVLLNVPFTSAEVSIYSETWKKVFNKSIKKPKTPLSTRRGSKRVIHREVIDGGDVVLREEKSDETLEWRCTPKTPKEASTTRWRHEYLPTTRLHIVDERILPLVKRSRSEHSWFTENQLDTFFASSVELLWSSYSSQVLGKVRKAQEQGLASILSAVLSTDSLRQRQHKHKLTATEAYARVQNFLRRQGSVSILGNEKEFEKRYSGDSVLQDVVQDIDSVEDKIKVAMASRNQLQDLITRMFTGNKEVRFTDETIEVETSSGDKIGLASLSSGEKHMLRILVPTIQVEESSMMIDEPELSLHVDWQTDLIHSMRVLNRDAQFIFATHSPEIMAKIPDDKIFRI